MRHLIAVMSVALAATGCGDEAADVVEPSAGGLTVTSPAFADAASIPVEFTCDGDGGSPPLAWSGVPDDAAALALVVDDPDAPGDTFVHWVVVDIVPTTTEVDGGEVPDGGVEIENSGGERGYVGPCPPEGEHTYRFSLYALETPTGLGRSASWEEAFDAIEKRAVADGLLTGTYER